MRPEAPAAVIVCLPNGPTVLSAGIVPVHENAPVSTSAVPEHNVTDGVADTRVAYVTDTDSPRTKLPVIVLTVTAVPASPATGDADTTNNPQFHDPKSAPFDKL